jgi:hypothetical protein
VGEGDLDGAGEGDLDGAGGEGDRVGTGEREDLL